MKQNEKLPHFCGIFCAYRPVQGKCAAQAARRRKQFPYSIQSSSFFWAVDSMSLIRLS